MDRGAWRTTVYVVSENQTRLSAEHAQQKVTQQCTATTPQNNCLSVRDTQAANGKRRQAEGGPRARQEPGGGGG